MPKIINLKLELRFWGTIFQTKVSLEDKLVNPWSSNQTDHSFYRILKNYSIDGDLDVKIESSGINGSQVDLKIINTDSNTLIGNPIYETENGVINKSSSYKV